MNILRIIVLIPFVPVFGWDLPPGFNKTDDQLRYSMDQRWQPIRKVILRPEDKQRIFNAYQAFVKKIEKQARQPYSIKRSRSLSGTLLSGTSITEGSLSGIITPTGTTNISGNIMSSGQFASAPLGLPGPNQVGTIILTNESQPNSGPTPHTEIKNTILTGGTGGSGMIDIVWYEYRQRKVVCDVLSQLEKIIDTHGFALRRNIIGASNPRMKHRLMIHREILEYLRHINNHTLTTLYGGNRSIIIINDHPVTQWTCSY